MSTYQARLIVLYRDDTLDPPRWCVAAIHETQGGARRQAQDYAAAGYDADVVQGRIVASYPSTRGRRDGDPDAR